MKFQHLTKKEFHDRFNQLMRNRYRKDTEEATMEEKYQVFSELTKDAIIDRWIATQDAMKETDPKIVYYMSMEFLVGRALGNNLLNIGSYDLAKEYLEEIGIDINAMEDQEPDPALGNGGLGRLAACFMDSLSTLGYGAYGCGIRYRYGMFKQEIEDGYQKEVPDNWLRTLIPSNSEETNTVMKSSSAVMYVPNPSLMAICSMFRMATIALWQFPMTCPS